MNEQTRDSKEENVSKGMEAGTGGPVQEGLEMKESMTQSLRAEGRVLENRGQESGETPGPPHPQGSPDRSPEEVGFPSSVISIFSRLILHQLTHLLNSHIFGTCDLSPGPRKCITRKLSYLCSTAAWPEFRTRGQRVPRQRLVGEAEPCTGVLVG